MNKKIEHLGEKEFKELIKESVGSVLTEIGYRTAASPHDANYNAGRSQETGGASNAVNKMNVADSLRLKSLNSAIHSSSPNLELNFIERDKANQFYSVVLLFNEIKYVDRDRFVMSGQLSICGRKPENGYIEFNFKTQMFYRVRFYTSGTVRRIFPLRMDNNYTSVFKNFLLYVTNFLYSEEDYENRVNTNRPTILKNERQKRFTE